MPEPMTYSDSIFINAQPREVYAVVSDITRTGEWSPVCTGCWWDEDDSARPGAWFTGRNETPNRTWETRSQVVEAEEGRAFSWSVGPGRVLWGYSMSEASDPAVTAGTDDGAGAETTGDKTTGAETTGTLLTESWEFLPAGREFFKDKFGDDADAQIAERRGAAMTGIPATLAAIKRVIEG